MQFELFFKGATTGGLAVIAAMVVTLLRVDLRSAVILRRKGKLTVVPIRITPFQPGRIR